MEEYGFGPNGALVYRYNIRYIFFYYSFLSMEYLMNHTDWLIEALDDFDEDYIIFDFPGQIELFSHINIMNRLIKLLQNLGYALYII
jgi:hypothetical protein